MFNEFGVIFAKDKQTILISPRMVLCQTNNVVRLLQVNRQCVIPEIDCQALNKTGEAIRRCFDRVWHTGRLQVFEGYVSGHLIQSFLSNGGM